MHDPVSVKSNTEQQLYNFLTNIERALNCTNNGQLIEHLLRDKEVIINELQERQYIETFKAAQPFSGSLTRDVLADAEEAELQKSLDKKINKK